MDPFTLIVVLALSVLLGALIFSVWPLVLVGLAMMWFVGMFG